MSDPVNDAERAERIRRLQARRATSAPGSRKRRHPAAATRWLLGGLSVASFFTIAGTVAVANQTDVAATPTPTASSVSATPATSATSPPTAAPAQSTRSTVPSAAHTTTRGS